MFNENNSDTEKTSRKVDNLINLVENHTRTKRHLEQYSHIGNPESKQSAREKQVVREEQISELKDQLVNPSFDTPNKFEEIQNIKENIMYSQNYIEQNKDHMNHQDLQNLEQRQQHRKEQLNNLEDNK